MLNIPDSICRYLNGEVADESEVQSLKATLPPHLVPDWFLGLLAKYKLSGENFTLSENLDLSGHGAEVVWLRPAQIISEAIESQPGVSVLREGFLPIGACAIGSGDPYFLDLRDGNEDPPVVRIPHDYAGNGRYPLDRIEIVSSTLSSFFETATFSR